MNQAVRIIRDEHRAIAAVVHGLTRLAKAAQDPSLKPDFKVFRAMIYYIDAFPERLHHPKEDRHLFARLAARAPQARQLIEELSAEHVMGVQLVRDLEQALLAFEETWPKGAKAFADAVAAYADFHWSHMKKEEEQLMPLAEAALGAEDWSAIEAAFAANEDPLAGGVEDFDRLYTKIVNLAPQPIGLGAQWKKAQA